MPGVDALTCPSCGASVDIGDAQNEIVRCSYCGTVLHLPVAPPPEPEPSITYTAPPVVIHVETPTPVVVTAQPRRANRLAIAALLAALIAGAVILIIAVFPGISVFTLRLWNEVVVLDPGENGPPTLLARMENSDTEQHLLVLLDAQTRKLKWKSAPILSEEVRWHFPVPGGDMIYVPDGANLLAFKSATGELAWKQPLVSGVDSSCQDCVRLIGGKILALSKDGTLQAFDADSGAPSWKVRANTSPRALLLANGKPALVDQDDQKHDALFIYDPASGEVERRIGASCPEGKPDPSDGGRVEDVYLSPDGKLAYVMYYNYGSDYPPCVQQVDLTSHKVVWEVFPKEGEIWPSAWFASKVLIAAEGIFFYEDNVLAFIDAKTGSLRELQKAPRYREVTPLVSLPGRVVVIAIPDYDSDAKELWGIDTASGQRVWTYKMQAKSIIDPWRVRLTSAGVVVVQGLRDRKASTWEVLDPVSGASQGERVISTSDYDFLDDTWTASTAYLTLDLKLYAIDIQTGKTQYTWP
jgi:outer membrane protein assembly factor BamB